MHPPLRNSINDNNPSSQELVSCDLRLDPLLHTFGKFCLLCLRLHGVGSHMNDISPRELSGLLGTVDPNDSGVRDIWVRKEDAFQLSRWNLETLQHLVSMPSSIL